MDQESRMTSASNGVRNKATSLVMSKEVSYEEEGKPASKMCSYVYRFQEVQMYRCQNQSPNTAQPRDQANNGFLGGTHQLLSL